MKDKTTNTQNHSLFYGLRKENNDVFVHFIMGEPMFVDKDFTLDYYLEFIPAIQSKEQVKNSYQSALTTPGKYVNSYVLTLEGHPTYWVKDVLISDGENVQGMIMEISQITIEEEENYRSIELLQKILDTIQVGIVLINQESMQIELVNDCFLEMMQTNAKEVMNKKCYEIICQRDIDFCPHLNDLDSDSIVGERFLKRQDGTIIPVINYGTKIEFAKKKFFINSFVDLSIQKGLEKKLFDAKQTADFANKSKTEFLSNMSHEMRTPLNAVIGMVQIAKKVDDIEKLKNNLDIIEISSKHLLNLINDVLDLSKIEEGKLELFNENFSLKEMITRILAVIRPKIEEKTIDFKYIEQGDMEEWVIGDSMRLSQAILNFLSNAIKFTKNNNKVSFSMISQGIVNQKIKLTFSIVDTGIGMSEEQVQKLFKPFQQADGKISRKYGGTGLGLAISKKIINLMGSDIHVQTKLGEGSTFSFEIILPLANYKKDTLSGNIKLKEDIFLGKRALLVDDLEINRIVAKELLGETGLIMDEAVDGQDALEKFLATDYDVILMDVQMPIMDGYEATKAIRKLGLRGQNIPIIAMSANVFKEDVEKSLEIGMNDHIAKPIDYDICVSVINKWFTQKQILGSKWRLDEDALLIINNPHFIDLPKALVNNNNNSELLAQEISAFINYNYMKKLNEYANDDDIDGFIIAYNDFNDRAKKLVLNHVLVNCEKISNHLKNNNFAFSKLILPNLANSYTKTVEILKTIIKNVD